MKVQKITFLLFFLLAGTFTVKGQSSSLLAEDTRNAVTTPSSYKRELRVSFKANNVIGLPVSTYYSTVLGIRGWTDDTGGKAHELALNNEGFYLRSGNSSTWEGWRKIVVENSNGNVGIGTLTPRERLSVNGNIRAKEIKVEATNWPDYVFKPEYKLMPLKEIEQHIEQHGHLPSIPKAAQIEENGIELGEMNKLMMKKIEELTLHLIEKDKEIEKLKELEKRIELLERK